ncbi:MAG: hypothetical protein WA952_04175 [Lewinella sp.]
MQDPTLLTVHTISWVSWLLISVATVVSFLVWYDSFHSAGCRPDGDIRPGRPVPP